MVGSEAPPRILVIDDLSGRTLPDRRNEDRANLCGQYLLEDMTGDEADKESEQRIKKTCRASGISTGPEARLLHHR